MTPLLALFALKPLLSNEEAVAVAKRFVVDLGIPTSGNLKSVRKNPPGAWGRPSTWDMFFDRPEGGWFDVTLDGLGTVFRASSSDLAKAGRPRPAEELELSRKVLAKLPHALPVRHGPRDGDTFHALVNGLQIFNLNPTYGYVINFDTQGQLTLFLREDVLPRTNARTPTIDQKTALLKFEEAWREADDGMRRDNEHIETELGYYAFPSEDKARLVWRGTIVQAFKGRPIEVGQLENVIDAMTGESIEVRN